MFLAALGGSTLQAAPKKGKAKVSAAKVSYEIEELTVADSKGKGCMMKYQRRHAIGAYDKNVGFNMMCCDYS